MSEIKAVILLVLVAAFGIGGWTIYEQSNKIDDLNTTITFQSQKIDKLVLDATKQQGSSAIDNEMTNRAVIEGRSIDDIAKEKETIANDKESAIRKKYEKLIADAKAHAALNTPVAPVAPSTEIERLEQEQSVQISIGRLESLWEEYCTVAEDPHCAGKPLPGVTHE